MLFSLDVVIKVGIPIVFQRFEALQRLVALWRQPNMLRILDLLFARR